MVLFFVVFVSFGGFVFFMLRMEGRLVEEVLSTPVIGVEKWGYFWYNYGK